MRRIFTRVTWIVLGLLLVLSAFVYVAFPQWLLGAWIVAMRSSEGLERKEIQVGEWTLPYLEAGHQHDGTPLLLLHGFGGTKDTLIEMASGLSKTRRVLAPDLPGFGETDVRPGFDYHPQFYVDTIVGFLNALQLERAHVVGYSMSGAFAAMVANQAPERVATLTLFAPAGIDGAQPSDLERMRNGDGTNPMAFNDRQGLERFLRMVFVEVPPLPGFALRGIVAKGTVQKELHDEILDDLYRAKDTESFEKNVRELHVPTLILWGERDRLVHVSAATRWKQLNPRIELKLFPEHGHGLVYQRTDHLLPILRGHMRRENRPDGPSPAGHTLP